jgi:hypothetical protein
VDVDEAFYWVLDKVVTKVSVPIHVNAGVAWKGASCESMIELFGAANRVQSMERSETDVDAANGVRWVWTRSMVFLMRPGATRWWTTCAKRMRMWLERECGGSRQVKRCDTIKQKT